MIVERGTSALLWDRVEGVLLMDLNERHDYRNAGADGVGSENNPNVARSLEVEATIHAKQPPSTKFDAKGNVRRVAARETNTEMLLASSANSELSRESVIRISWGLAARLRRDTNYTTLLSVNVRITPAQRCLPST